MSAAAYDYDSASRRPRAVEEWLDLVAHRALVLALVDRDLKIRYKRSVFGVIWTMLNPVAMLVIVSLVFARPFAPHAPAYPAFAAPGVLLWNFFAQTTGLVGREVAAGVDLWRRVRAPRTALVIATVLTGVLNLLLALVPLVLVLAVAGRPLGPALATLPLTVGLTAAFVLGVSLGLAAVALYFPDVADLYAMLLPALMFTAPVVYPAAIVPGALARLLRLNPMTLYIEAFRAPLYGNTSPTAEAMAIMGGVAAIVLLAGWLLFTRCADDIPYRV